MAQQLFQIAQRNYENYLAATGRQPRVGQQVMMKAICSALEASGDRVAVIEAGTGTGKSLAYLCGAAPVAKKLNKKLVIATGTVQLQQQLELRL